MPAAPRTAVFAFAVLALLGAACTKEEAPTTGAPPATEEATAPPAGESPDTEPTAGGEVGTASLPSGFPSSFPLPDGSAPVYSFGDASGLYVWFSSPESIEDLKAFFEGELPGAGWTVESAGEYSGPEGTVVTLTVSGEGWTGLVMLGTGDAASTFEGDFAFYVALNPVA
ncbi:MAG TPA: hypothetical protein VJN50_02920 [Actinomycetota bacterium]|nr:hypothetical protein [Actinomycetota bacterium]